MMGDPVTAAIIAESLRDKFGPSLQFLKHCAEVSMSRQLDEQYLASAIASGKAVRGNERYPNAVFINGEGPMIDLVAVRRLRSMDES